MAEFDVTWAFDEDPATVFRIIGGTPYLTLILRFAPSADATVISHSRIWG